MTIETQFKVRSNPYLYRYLRENSYWYKYLNRDPRSLHDMEEEMKKQYRMRTTDKINNISRGLELIRSFMDVL